MSIDQGLQVRTCVERTTRSAQGSDKIVGIRGLPEPEMRTTMRRSRASEEAASDMDAGPIESLN